MSTAVDKDTPLRLDRAAERHTPGPWRLVRFEIMSSANEGCHVVACSDPAWGHNRNGANALLIAAAPDLLAALRPFAEPHAMGDNYVQFAPRLIESARAAIAKATGLASPHGERE